jgi:DNA polymerase-3 subunit beta
MQIHVSRSAFAQALTAVTGTATVSLENPVLASVLLVADAKAATLELTASNLRQRISTAISGNVAEAGSLTIPAKRLLTILNAMTGDVVALSCERDGQRLKLVSDGSCYLLFAGDSEHFPAVTSAIEDAVTDLSLPRSAFFGLLARVAPAQGDNDERPILNGTQLRLLTADGIRFLKATAYNRRVCITDQIPIDPTPVSDFTVVIPAAAVNELLRLAGPVESSTMELSVTSSSLRLSFLSPGTKPEARQRIRYDTALLSEGVFPDTSKALQIATTAGTSLPPSALPDAVSRVALATSLHPQHRMIRTVFNENGLSLTAQSEGFGEAREKIMGLTKPNAGAEESRSACLNPALVSQILKPIADRELHVSLQGPQSLLLISTAGFYRSAVAPMVMPATSSARN